MLRPRVSLSRLGGMAWPLIRTEAHHWCAFCPTWNRFTAFPSGVLQMLQVPFLRWLDVFRRVNLIRRCPWRRLELPGQRLTSRLTQAAGDRAGHQDASPCRVSTRCIQARSQKQGWPPESACQQGAVLTSSALNRYCAAQARGGAITSASQT